jgi:hypothetical protein
MICLHISVEKTFCYISYSVCYQTIILETKVMQATLHLNDLLTHFGRENIMLYQLFSLLPNNKVVKSFKKNKVVKQ